MTSLKYKDTDGTWKVIPIVGPPGAGVPAGGAAGDILVKQSATDRDTGWRAPATQPWVLKAGDTMTGPLTINMPNHPQGLGLTIANPGAANEGGEILLAGAGSYGNVNLDNFQGVFRLLMPGAPGGVGFSVSAAGLGTFSGGAQINGGNVTTPNCFISTGGGESFRLYANGYMSFYNGGTRVGYFQANGNQIFLNAEISGSTIRIRGNNGLYLDNGINNYQLSESVIGTRVVCTNANGYIFGNYINMSADTGGDAPYLAGQNGDSYMRWYNSLNANKISWGSTGSQIQGTRVAGGSYWDQTFFANPSTSMAGYGWHPGGTAGSIRMQMNVATFHFNNVDASWYYDTIAKSFGVASSRRGKQQLTPLVSVLPEMPKLPVATMVRALRPVWWRTREDYTMREVPPCPDDVEPHDWHPDPATMPNHACRVEMCGHTPDDPCCWRVNWQRGQLGFVAEEVERVLPQLVQLDADMQPAAVDLGSLVGLAYAMLQELDTRLTALEAA
jgi:hypothetical protein